MLPARISRRRGTFDACAGFIIIFASERTPLLVAMQCDDEFMSDDEFIAQLTALLQGDSGRPWSEDATYAAGSL